VTQELLKYEGGATTLIANLVNTLSTMQNITNHIQTQYDNENPTALRRSNRKKTKNGCANKRMF